MEKQDTLCAIIVSYNRKELLIDCLVALKQQTSILDAVLIVDNASTDGTPEILYNNGYLPEVPPNNFQTTWETLIKTNNFSQNSYQVIHYIRMNKNTGGSGGFHEGLKRAYEMGYEWFWLMDDDVEPDKNCLRELLLYCYQNNVFITVPARFYQDKEFVKSESKKINLSNPLFGLKRKFVSKKDLFKSVPIECFPFEGVLIHKKVVQAIGYPNPDYFIFCDDTDYSIRALRAGFKIYLISSALLIRKIKPVTKKCLDWKSYYYIRNLIAIDKMYGNSITYSFRPLFFILRFIFAGLYHMRKKIEWRIIFQAFKDGNKLLLRSTFKYQK